jgi:adenylate kinase
VVPGARLVVLGKQGAGKGTQCLRLSHHYVIPHIATGDMLRAAAKSRMPLGLEVRSHLDAGDLIPDEVVLRMVADRLEQDDTRTRGFVLDGFPRTVAQAEGLEKMLHPTELDLAISLVVPTEVVLHRLASRRVCVDCGAIYSLAAPPKFDWVCDVCGGEVVQREDDTEASIRHRLDLYDESTAPLVDWYRDAAKLVEISGVGSTDEVFYDRLVPVIDEYQRSGTFTAPAPPPDSGEAARKARREADSRRFAPAGAAARLGLRFQRGRSSRPEGERGERGERAYKRGKSEEEVGERAEGPDHKGEARGEPSERGERSAGEEA